MYIEMSSVFLKTRPFLVSPLSMFPWTWTSWSNWCHICNIWALHSNISIILFASVANLIRIKAILKIAYLAKLLQKWLRLEFGPKHPKGFWPSQHLGLAFLKLFESRWICLSFNFKGTQSQDIRGFPTGPEHLSLKIHNIEFDINVL